MHVKCKSQRMLYLFIVVLNIYRIASFKISIATLSSTLNLIKLIVNIRCMVFDV